MFAFLWDFGGFGGPGSFFGGVVFIFSGRTLTKIAHVCSVFFLFGMFYIVFEVLMGNIMFVGQ